MESILKSDIFFFITSVAVVFLALIFALILVYALRILRDVKQISTIAKDQAQKFSGDLDDLRMKIREQTWKWSWSGVVGGITKLFNRKGRHDK
jgi:hypothetical protein